MAKTKEQKRLEARQRALSNTARRTDDLIWWVRHFHQELALDTWDKWTLNTLRDKVAHFYNHLKDCGLPHDVGAFYIMHNKVLVAQDLDLTYKRNQRKCLYCLQPFGQYHKAPCAHSQGGRVANHEALYIDERK